MRQAPVRGAPRPAKPHGCRHCAALDPARGPAERRSRPAGPAQVDASWAPIGARSPPNGEETLMLGAVADLVDASKRHETATDRLVWLTRHWISERSRK